MYMKKNLVSRGYYFSRSVAGPKLSSRIYIYIYIYKIYNIYIYNVLLYMAKLIHNYIWPHGGPYNLQLTLFHRPLTMQNHRS